jgi:hypothetical protein
MAKKLYVCTASDIESVIGWQIRRNTGRVWTPDSTPPVSVPTDSIPIYNAVGDNEFLCNHVYVKRQETADE